MCRGAEVSGIGPIYCGVAPFALTVYSKNAWRCERYICSGPATSVSPLASSQTFAQAEGPKGN